MKLRIGLIGLGSAWQSRHRPALRMLHDRFDVRAVYSSISKLAENSAAEFQADPVDGYRTLVQRCDIDAVMILERSWQGWLPVLAACEAGKAVYWAGDLDFGASEDNDIRQAIEQSGVAFMAELPRRFAPATLRLKELIATRLGAPKLIFCHRRLQIPEDAANRTDTIRMDVEKELVELVDWCRYVIGREPSDVSCTVHGNTVHDNSVNDNQSATDYESLSLEFKQSGDLPPVTAQISCGDYISSSWPEAVNFRPPAAMQICCERGVAFVDLPSTVTWFDDAGRHLESLEGEATVGEQLLTHFHRAVTSLVRNLGDLNDAHRACRIVLAARESARDGRRISVSDS